MSVRAQHPAWWIAWVLAVLWAGMPLYPAFIALLPIAAPGYSLLAPPVALGVLLIVAGLTALLAVELWRTQGRALLRDRLVRAMLVYLASLAFATCLGLVPIVGALFFAITLCTCIGTCAVRCWGADARIAQAMASSLLLSSGVGSLVALACWILRVPAGLFTVGNGRAIGSFVVPGELAGYLGMLLPYSVGVACWGRSSSLRMGAWIVAGLNLAALLATFSRAGLAGLLLATVVALVALRSRWLPWVGVGLLVLLSQLRQLINLHHNPAENFNRFSIWQAAWRAGELFPLWGVGPGGFARIYPLVKRPDGEPLAFHAHNFLLTTWVESGILGLLALLFLWWTFGQMVIERYRHASPRARGMAVALLIGFTATWLQSMLDVVQILFLGLWIPFMGMTLVALEEGAA